MNGLLFGTAEVDYRAAQQLLKGEVPIREAIAFHCQQAAEKYLKAFLVRHQLCEPGHRGTLFESAY